MPRKSKCKSRVQKKIRKNISEFYKGLYKNKKQAIAVAYKQVQQKYPACKRILVRK